MPTYYCDECETEIFSQFVFDNKHVELMDWKRDRNDNCQLCDGHVRPIVSVNIVPKIPFQAIQHTGDHKFLFKWFDKYFPDAYYGYTTGSRSGKVGLGIEFGTPKDKYKFFHCYIFPYVMPGEWIVVTPDGRFKGMSDEEFRNTYDIAS